jgi:hypothetical protein
VPLCTTPAGDHCINIHARSAQHVFNPTIVDHQVLVGNICGQSIKVQVCYYQTSSCITVVVDGYQKVERVLGIAPASMKNFRFEYREIS